MTTLFTHIAIPLAAKLGLKTKLSKRLFWVLLACAILPDLDVVTFKLGIAYSSQWGHRGFSHSIGLAVIIGVLVALAAPKLQASRSLAGLLAAFTLLSHNLLDMATNGGLGCAIFWPFSTNRYFLPWTPIQVSPLHPRHWMSEPFLNVLRSELLLVWLPLAGMFLLMFLLRKFRTRTKNVEKSL